MELREQICVDICRPLLMDSCWISVLEKHDYLIVKEKNQLSTSIDNNVTAPVSANFTITTLVKIYQDYNMFLTSMTFILSILSQILTSRMVLWRKVLDIL